MTQTTKHEYTVTIPIAGHVTVSVEAESEQQAKELAFDSDLSEGDVTWEAVETFTKGNVCYCPQPWNVEVTDEGEAP